MKLILTCLSFLCLQVLFAQSGCTDIQATNFSSNAIQNDGSCIYTPSTANFLLKGDLPSSISESSGIAYFNGDILTHNDSGNNAELFIIDSSNGNLKQTIIIDNYSNTDWEDICTDADYIYVGDFGNNEGSRQDLKILKIKRSDIGSESTIHVDAKAIHFSYADQTSYISSNTTNFDCEAFFSMGNYLYLFTKDSGDGKTRVYKISTTPSTYILSYYTEYAINGLITGAAYNAATNEVALIGYELDKYSSFIWILSDFEQDDFFTGNKRKFTASNFHYWQTEGIAYDTINNKIFISSETTIFLHASLFVLDHTESLATAIQPAYTISSHNIFPNPATEHIRITNSEPITEIEIFDTMGRIIYKESVSTNDYELQLNHFDYTDGVYCIRIHGNNYQWQQSLILKHE